MKRFVYLFFLLIVSGSVLAQKGSDTGSVYQMDKKSSNSIQSATKKLSKSLETDAGSLKVAENYEDLAKELANRGEYQKAEDYLNKAKQIYLSKNKTSKVSKLNREIAKLQEAQKNYKGAILHYEEAEKATSDEVLKQVNQNDANRLRNVNNPVSQESYIKDNIQLLENTKAVDDKADAYKQMAETKMKLNESEAAVKNYEKAVNTLNSRQAEDFQVKRDLAEAYLASPQAEKGIETLQEVYRQALADNQTLEAKKSVELLAGAFQKEGKTQKAVELYRDFLSHLELLIQADSSLVDIKWFQATEEKIIRLEKERVLKDELIRKKNVFNYALIGFIALMLLLLMLIVRALISIKNKNRKIALQSLRREMNPHFIFNSLNSVNQFIARNNELEANKYLTSYSRLMRNVMENSSKDFVKLSNEIEQMREYLDLEHLRFSDQFDYKIQIDETLDPESVFIPNMLIQPHLENAIWHGLRYKEAKGCLHLSFQKKGNKLIVKIEDNGIGRIQSQALKTEHQKVHRSRGLTNINERIKLLNELYKLNIELKISDQQSPESGVVVELKIPLTNRNQT